MESNVSNFKQNIEEIKSGSYFINLIKTETGIEKTCTSLVSGKNFRMLRKIYFMKWLFH